MWKSTYSKFYSGISPEVVWKLWTDINNWPVWHDDLVECKLEGEFKVGARFMLKPKGAPAVKIVLTEVVEMERFTDCALFFFAKMYNTHTIEVKNDGVILSNELVVTGPLKWLWVKLVAKHVAESVPEEIDALIHLARKKAPKKS
ncbi:MAG: SRPBCC family protein [Chlamydiia bacterium]|nr:SRPBCC family protein [Chlamydiia bacterium]